MTSTASKQQTKPQGSKPAMKIDLGAAATLVNVAKAAENQASENGMKGQGASTAGGASAMNDLVDLMNAGPSDAPLVPMNKTEETDLFGGFASAPATGKYFLFFIFSKKSS